MSVSIYTPKNQHSTDEIQCDTIWFFAWNSSVQFPFPVYYYTEILDTLYMAVDEHQALMDEVHIYPNPFTSEVTLDFKNDDACNPTISVFNMQGGLIKDLSHNGFDYEGSTIVWDGRNDSGNLVKNGVYMVLVKTGSNRYFRKLIFMGNR
nr:T9SS type A sorting domain-containing protein [Bacteroidota bacterium]